MHQKNMKGNFMKRVFVCFGLLFGSLLAAQNLLENPSFEQVRENMPSRPAVWSTWGEKTVGENTYSIEEKNVFAGKRALRINHKRTTSMALWMHSNLGAKLKAVPAGTEMELSVFARAAKGTANSRVYLEAIKAKRLFISNTKVDDESWTKIVVRFKKENLDYGSPYVCLAVAGQGDIIYDCAYLGEAGKNPYKIYETSENFIVNGNLDKTGKDGTPLHWRIFNHSKNGKASVTTSNVSSGKRALQLYCPGKPDGMLAWDHRFAADAFDGVEPGTEMVLSLKGNTHGNPGTIFRFYIEFMRGGKYIGTYIAHNQSIYVGWMEKSLRFKMPKERPDRANVYVQLMSGGTLSFDDISLKLAKNVPVKKIEPLSVDYCRIANTMPPVNTFFGDVRPSEIQIEHFISSPELKIELSEINGKKIKEWNFKDLAVKKAAVLKLELPKLDKGAYELVFKSGKLVDYEWFRIRDKQTRGAYIMQNGILNLDGKPFFPIGIVTPNNSLDAFRVYSESGINTVTGRVTTADQMAEYVLNVFKHFNFACVEWNNWGMNSLVKEDELAKNFSRQADFLRKYPNFIGFMSDEAPWNSWKLESMRRHYKMMYKHLPDYISWMNNAPRLTGPASDPRQAFASVRAYSRASDITGLDIYPVPEGTGHNNLKNKTISCVGDYTDLCFESVWGQKPVWMILQAFSWSEGGSRKPTAANPRPNKKQLRFMIWNAITHGATGIFWYGNGAKDVYSDWWSDFAEVNLELAAVAKLMLAAPYQQIKGLPDKVRGIEGKGFKVIVNENPKKSVTFSGREIEGQGVLILTDKSLDIPEVKRFVPQKTQVVTDTGVYSKSVLMDAQWTAHPEYLQGSYRKLWARHIINVDKIPSAASVRVSVDDIAELFVNGRSLGKSDGHLVVTEFNIGKYLKKGENVISFEVTNGTGPTGLVYEISIDGKKYPSGNDTMYSFDNKTNWKKAHSFGKPPCRPWGTPEMFIEKR